MMAHHPALAGFLIGLFIGGTAGFMLAAVLAMDKCDRCPLDN